jgi:hypothetical protein
LTFAQINSTSSQNPHRRQYLQQSISLTGAGLPTFTTATRAIEAIQTVFACEFKEDRMERWQPPTYADMPRLNASNRYFTAAKDTVQSIQLLFTQLADPHGVLQSMQGQDLIHTSDNVVDYYKLLDDG